MYKSKIYKIVNNVNEDIYIGSTKNALRKRFSDHKALSKKDKCKNIRLFILAKEIGWECFRIILIEEFDCPNRQEQLKREQYWIDEFKPSLNKIDAYTSIAVKKEKKKIYQKEYDEKNKDKIKEKKKEYNEKNKDKKKIYCEKNKDKIKNYNKEYREKNKDKISKREKEYCENNKDILKQKSKIYREQNKDKIKNYNKYYSEKNKDKISQKRKSETYYCYDCDKSMRKDWVIRHNRTITHMSNVFPFILY